MKKFYYFIFYVFRKINGTFEKKKKINDLSFEGKNLQLILKFRLKKEEKKRNIFFLLNKKFR